MYRNRPHVVVIVCLGLAAYSYIYFLYFFKSFFITFIYFFRSYSFLFAVFWWPVQRAFVAFLVTRNKYDDDDDVCRRTSSKEQHQGREKQDD